MNVETLLTQFLSVQKKTNTSHVMEYGDMVCSVNRFSQFIVSFILAKRVSYFSKHLCIQVFQFLKFLSHLPAEFRQGAARPVSGQHAWLGANGRRTGDAARVACGRRSLRECASRESASAHRCRCRQRQVGGPSTPHERTAASAPGSKIFAHCFFHAYSIPIELFPLIDHWYWLGLPLTSQRRCATWSTRLSRMWYIKWRARHTKLLASCHMLTTLSSTSIATTLSSTSSPKIALACRRCGSCSSRCYFVSLKVLTLNLIN